MSEKEQALKVAFNTYIDALVAYMEEIKPACIIPSQNTAAQYLLDKNNNYPYFPDTLAVTHVYSFSTQRLLDRKIQ